MTKQSMEELFEQHDRLEANNVIGFAGRVSEDKGCTCALDAFKEVRKTLPNTLLLIAGDFETEEEGVETTGWIRPENMYMFYRTIDVMLVPSVYLDPFPRTCLEAQASGKPVVVTCYGGAQEAVVEGETGYVVNPFEAKDVAKKLVLAIKNKEEMGKRAQKHMEQNFSKAGMVKKYESVYKELI